jgi:hypothetical protein
MGGRLIRAIYACDVGSTRGKSPKFGRARIVPDRSSKVVGSFDIRVLVFFLGYDLIDGVSVALGFEAPLFMPVPDQAEELGRGRFGEGSRAMFAPARWAVATLGSHQAAWILRRLFLACGGECAFTLEWAGWPPEDPRPVLFCGEAFVSRAAHSLSLGGADVQDAATAVKESLDSGDDLGNGRRHHGSTLTRPVQTKLLRNLQTTCHGTIGFTPPCQIPSDAAKSAESKIPFRNHIFWHSAVRGGRAESNSDHMRVGGRNPETFS